MLPGCIERPVTWHSGTVVIDTVAVAIITLFVLVAMISLGSSTSCCAT